MENKFIRADDVAPVAKPEETKSKKPSVLAKLRQYQAEDRKEKSMQQCAERDL